MFAMNTTTIPDPALAQAITELIALGLRMARVVTEVTEAEQRTTAAAASWLPAQGATPASREEATQIGLGIDGADEALGHAAPRIATLSLCFDRLSRSVRRCVALARRIEQGWPPPRAASDTQRAMLLRQAARGAGEAIRARTQGEPEAAERLFADLAACLDDPAFEQDLLERPVEDMVQTLCRAIGLAPEPEPAAPAETAAPPGRARAPRRRHASG